jgi:hypothetical protein
MKIEKPGSDARLFAATTRGSRAGCRLVRSAPVLEWRNLTDFGRRRGWNRASILYIDGRRQSRPGGCRLHANFAAILSQPHARLTLMPRYFFNTRIDGELIRDPDGAELRDPDHAWSMARAMIRDILHDEDNEPRLLRAAIEVTDETGEVVLEFPFTEALIEPGQESKALH